jgi:DnaJ-class molecular chaperone
LKFFFDAPHSEGSCHDPDTQKKNLPCTSCKGKGKGGEALQIISIKITPCVECEGRVIIIKIKKSPHLHKMQARGKILLQKKTLPLQNTGGGSLVVCCHGACHPAYLAMVGAHSGARE